MGTTFIFEATLPFPSMQEIAGNDLGSGILSTSTKGAVTSIVTFRMLLQDAILWWLLISS